MGVGMCQLRLCGSRPQMLFPYVVLYTRIAIKANVQTGPDRFLHVPSWVITAVAERQPSSPMLSAHYPTMHSNANRKSTKLTSLKRPAAAAHLNLYSLTI